MIGVLEMPLDWRFSWGNRVSVFCLLVFGVEGGSLRRGKRRSKEGNRKFVQFAIQTKLIIFKHLFNFFKGSFFFRLNMYILHICS